MICEGVFKVMDLYYTILLFVFGTVFGSFFNVVGLRVPKGIKFANDRSYCPNCEKQLTWSELIPVLSYVFQGGKCRGCKQEISLIYPVVELSTGFLFAFSYYQIGLELELITAILLMSMLMIIFVTDMSYMLIPNKILLVFLPFLITMRIVVPLEPWYNAIIGGVVGYGLVALIILLSKGGMGAGDMKLLGVLGIVVGMGNVLLTFFLAALFGAIVGGILMVFQKVKRRQAIPFGPYIILATIITYFYGDYVIDWYLSLI